MSKKSNILAACAVLLGVGSANAAHFDSYDRFSTGNLPAAGFFMDTDGYKVYDARDNNALFATNLCTDTTHRKVPGMLKNGKCRVEWKGRSYDNDSFYLLRHNSNNFWRQVTNESDRAFVIQRGITTGVTDANELVFHCKINYNGQIAYGKYIPNHNGCFYSENGGGGYKSIHDNTPGVRVSVLVR